MGRTLRKNSHQSVFGGRVKSYTLIEEILNPIKVRFFYLFIYFSNFGQFVTGSGLTEEALPVCQRVWTSPNKQQAPLQIHSTTIR